MVERVYLNGTWKLIKDNIETQSILLLSMLERNDNLATCLRLDRVLREKKLQIRVYSCGGARNCMCERHMSEKISLGAFY